MDKNDKGFYEPQEQLQIQEIDNEKVREEEARRKFIINEATLKTLKIIERKQKVKTLN